MNNQGESPLGTKNPRTTTPNPPAGDPPAATTSVAGDPIAADACGREEALDLHYCSGSEEEDEVEESPARRKEGSKDGQSLRSVVVKPATHRVSYKDALVGVRTFRPRFNAAEEARGGWSVERRKERGRKSTVWDRMQPIRRSIHDRLWGEGEQSYQGRCPPIHQGEAGFQGASQR